MQPANSVFLLADDDGDDRELFTVALKEVDEDIVCYLATNGSEVFEVLEQCTQRLPDIIFLDVNMPRMNGWECLSRLQSDAAYAQIPVILYSTSSLPQDVERGLTGGAKCFITKPTDFEDLKQMLRVTAVNVGGDLQALGQLAKAKCN